MKNIIHWLLPKEKKFIDMLAEQSENAKLAASELKSFVDEYAELGRSERKSRAGSIKEIELKGDEIVQRIINGLEKNFRVPFDKEHIKNIAVLLDDITDLINAAASRFVILSIERIEGNIPKLINIIINLVDEVNEGISDLKKLKDVKAHYEKIYELEREADKVYSEALSELFHFYKNSIDIIKYKEIYDLLESAADKCKDVANIIEEIAAKQS